MTIFKSDYSDIAPSAFTITERSFQGFEGRLDEPCLIDGMTGETVTGRQFMERVKRLAGGLIANGLGGGATIAIMAPNSPEYAVAFHGVAWAGLLDRCVKTRYLAVVLEKSGAFYHFCSEIARYVV